MPSDDQQYNATLNAIRSLGGSAKNVEITQRVINDLGLPDELTQIPHGLGKADRTGV